MSAPDRAEWLAWRRGGLGATDVVAVAGLSDYAGPLTVHREKTGDYVPVDDDDEAQEFGRRWEPSALRWFEARTGLHALGEQTWCQHPQHPWRRCTVDAFAAESPDAALDEVLGPIEVKSFNVLADGELRADVLAQVLWQCHVTGYSRAWVCGLVGRQFQVRQVVVADHADDLAWLVKIAEEAWQRILDGVEPAPTAADLHMLGSVPAADPPVTVELDTDAVEALSRVRALKAEAKRLKAEIETAEAVVKAALGTAVVGTIAGDPVVTWHPQTSRRLVGLGDVEKQYPTLVPHLARWGFINENTSRVLRLGKD